jgi:nanoRNase/pAp phosphatase (c-di-AMP/oligoRNAs hydrolase)
MMAAALSRATRLRRLYGVLDGGRRLLIIMQNNPDPDALAAAAGLRLLAKEMHDMSCSVAHSGAIGRAENQALVKYLGFNTRDMVGLDLERFDRIGMVDAQPGAGNVSFDQSCRLDVVIDHHPIRRETRSARVTDVRSRYGATSTILWEYLDEARIEIPTRVATALVYGIRSDTQDLGRESTRADLDAYLALYPEANQRALGRIMSADLPRTYFALLRIALDQALLYGNRVVTQLGRLEAPEMVAEVADFLLRAEGVEWSMVSGVINGWLHISLRTTDGEGHAGKIARNLGGRKGFGGGHQALAAAQIPLPESSVEGVGLRRFVSRLERRFLRATGSSGGRGEPLSQS